MLEKWIKTLQEPMKTFKKEKKKADLNEALRNILFAGIVSGFIIGLSTMSIPTFFYYFIYYIVIAPLSLFFGSAIQYFFAILLGGKGNYTTQTYLLSLFIAPLTIVASVLTALFNIAVFSILGTTVLTSIPMAALAPVGILILLLGTISIGLAIYQLYLLTLALKETHGYTTGRAVMTWLLPMIIAIIFVIAVAIMVLSLFFAYNPSMMMAV